jgi:hypothetical protein
VHIATDIVDVNPDFNILQSLYHLVEPTCVLVISQVPDSFISMLKSLTGADSPSDNGASKENIHPERKLNILPRKDYSKLILSCYLLNCYPMSNMELCMIIAVVHNWCAAARCQV